MRNHICVHMSAYLANQPNTIYNRYQCIPRVYMYTHYYYCYYANERAGGSVKFPGECLFQHLPGAGESTCLSANL